ncbi:hypothetical protein [Deinococcus terrestris]|nr:hypothetical protein [Deinococcus terrestris]
MRRASPRVLAQSVHPAAMAATEPTVPSSSARSAAASFSGDPGDYAGR